MILDIGAIEDAMVAALQADATLAAVVQHCGPWQGELDRARTTGSVFKYPAILVAYAGGPISPRGMYAFGQQARFQVTVQCRNLRSPAATRSASATSERGAYDILPHVLRVLAGATLGLDIGELMPETLEPIATDRTDIAEYFIVFVTSVVLDMTDLTMAPTDTTDLVTITAAHTVGDVAVVTDTHTVETA